jgi:hypothetical protein
VCNSITEKSFINARLSLRLVTFTDGDVFVLAAFDPISCKIPSCKLEIRQGVLITQQQ